MTFPDVVVAPLQYVDCRRCQPSAKDPILKDATILRLDRVGVVIDRLTSRNAWRPDISRSSGGPATTPARLEVTLREVTAETVRAICDLDPGPGGNAFVAPNAVSIAQAHFDPAAWFRAIYAGDEPVGFIMLEDDVENQEYSLWRLMIDHRHQRHGYGRRAVELLIDYVRTRPGATELLTSYVPGERGPAEFYRGLGFTTTGQVDDDGEIEVRLGL